jgi:regulator of cell morphogenesis and NO signaling
MQIQSNMKMAEVIHVNYHLLQIISRFGICLGFGDKSVKQVCLDNSIDVDFFLEIVNSYNNKNYFPKRQLQGFSLRLIIEYLRKSHDFYLNTKIPQIAQLLKQLSDFAGSFTIESLQLIDKFFKEYKNELSVHIQREENKVYPYVFSVEEAFLTKNPTQEIITFIHKYSMEDYENEHDNVEDKLFDLKNIIIKYLPLPVDSNLSNAILFELFRLETDLKDHARIEDKVLVPKVKYMEKWILEHFTT